MIVIAIKLLNQSISPKEERGSYYAWIIGTISHSSHRNNITALIKELALGYTATKHLKKI